MITAPFDAFEDWLHRARPKLLRLASSRLRDLGEAEDVVQETVLAVWRRHRMGAVVDLDAYAARAVWQNAIRRSVRRRRFETLEDAELEGHASAPAVEAWMDSLDLERAIAGLPLAQQTVLRLRFYTGLSFRETAEALEISLNTAASRCRYALESLRKGLKPQKEEDHVAQGNVSQARPRRNAASRVELRRRGSGGGRRKP